MFGTSDLSWMEVADALWLTAATQFAWGRYRTGDAAQRPDEAGGDDPQLEGRDPFRDAEEDQGQPESLVPSSENGDDGTDSVAEQASPASVVTAPPGSRFPATGPNLVRALRPFKQEVQSPHDEDAVLDEELTAERAVEDGLWLPMTRPGTTRWLDLTLVVDTHPSMALWRSTIAGFTRALERLGAFRSIQRRSLDTTADTPVLRGGSARTPVRSPAELIDPSGRRVVLVLTDGVAACWRRGSVEPLLAQWGASMSVAVAHLLPQRLWRRRGMRPHRAKVTTPRPVAPNQQWRVELPDAWLEPDPSPPPRLGRRPGPGVGGAVALALGAAGHRTVR